MPEYEFVVINELSNPNSNANYVIPKNVIHVIEIPIFGSNRSEEFVSNSNYLLVKRIVKTNEDVIKNKFLPLYEKFMKTIFSDRCDPQTLIDLIIKLHDILVVYDPKKCLEHYLTWEIFIKVLSDDPLYRNMTLKESLTAYQLIQRNIQLLALQVPPVDIIHCSLAWLPSLIAIFAKKESNCPVIITEHGVAFRELLLYYNAYLYDEPAKLFWKVFSHNIVRAVYSIADLITPVCYANKNWEEKLGADSSKIKVIYNGVNTSKFRPIPITREDKRPTIVSVARIDPFKDIICLIQAVKYSKEQIPDIQCLIYGASTDLDYSNRCIKAVKELHLEDNVKFMGGTKEPEKAFNMADIIVMSSITEGFPFTVIEAMACGKAVVASDVGGVREALDGCGLLVRSRRPHDLARGIVTLLKEEKLRKKFEESALEKIHAEFTLEKCINRFKEEYEQLTQHKIDSVQVIPN